MKKLLNISLVLLVFVLSGSLSCESWCDSRRAKLAEPDHAERFLPDTARKPIIAAPVKKAPAAVERPASAGPRAVATSEFSVRSPKDNQLKLSRIYPTPEFAIIQMDKTMPKEVGLNKLFDYSIKVTNLTNITLTNVVITEDLPKNFKFAGSNPPAKKYVANLVWRIDSLEPKASERITVSGKATDIDPLKLSTTVVTHFVPVYASLKVIQPRLELTKTSPGQVSLCDQIPVQFVVTNTGTGTARNVKIVDTLADELQTTNGENELIIDVGMLMEGQSRKFSSKLRATKTGKYVSKAVATATGLKDVSQETTIIVGQPVLAVQKTGSKHQYVGRPVTYKITVTNKSNAPARNTVIEDTIPRGIRSIKATAGAKLYRTGKVVWQLGTLAPNAFKTVRVSYIPTKIGTLTDKTTATAYCAKGVTALAETSIAGISGILLEVVDLEDPVEIGSTTMYEIKVTNQGSAPATGIHISCILEDNVRYVSSTGATVSSIEANILNFAPLGNLAPGVKATWRVVVEAITPADTRFKVTMNADQLSRPVEENEATHLYNLYK